MKNFSKKLSAAAMVAVVAVGIAPCASAADVKWGDINGDGSIDILDIVIMRDHIVNGTPIEDKSYLIDDSNNTTDLEEGQVNLMDTNILYDGVGYATYLASDPDTFSMGANTYNEGFVIWDDHSLFGVGDGYVLLDLNGKYSSISFDVGKTNEYEMQDVTLNVYLDGKFAEQHQLNAQTPPTSISIDLDYSDSLKLEIVGGSRVKYGFANIILNK